MLRIILATLLLISLIVHAHNATNAPTASVAQTVKPPSGVEQADDDDDDDDTDACWRIRHRHRHHHHHHALFDRQFDFDFDFDFDFNPGDLDHVIATELDKNQSASCPTGAVCDYRCPLGGCEIACESGSVCGTACPKGGCKLS